MSPYSRGGAWLADYLAELATFPAAATMTRSIRRRSSLHGREGGRERRRAFTFPSCAGEGGAKRRMGCGPLHEPQSVWTNVAANVSRIRAFRTLCWPHLPRFLEHEFMSRAAPHECAR